MEIEGAAARRNAFNAIPREGQYADLNSAKNAGELTEAIAAWEQAHPELCEAVQDDGQFFGFTNVANGSLQKATSFVLVPAVRDASIDAVDAKNSAIGQLMELIVRSAVQSRQDIQAFQAQISERYRTLTDPANLTELGGLATDISGTLQQYYSEVGVSLTWRPAEDFAVPLPSAEVKLKDDDVEVLVDRAGHGVQRAFVLALLQHLARANITAALTQEAAAADAQEPAAEPAPAPVQPVMPGLILAIEEPELYQHPTKQRHFARVLNDLSRGKIPGMATSTQIIFATHSPLFVAMDRFDEVRLFRKVKPAADQRKQAVCSTANLSTVVTTIETAAQKPAGTFSVESTKTRLHVIGPEVGEGFFAKTVVLVEGVSDKAALIAAAAMKNVSFEAEGIAILPVNGKENLDKPWAVFTSIGIPVYAIWDSDKGNAKNAEASIRANKHLLRLVGAPQVDVDYPEAITDKYACFSDKLETTLKAEIGDALLLEVLQAKVDEFGLKSKEDGLKNPEIMTQVLAAAVAKKAMSKSLDQIVDRILVLNGTPAAAAA
jgi:hypothetical protein